MAVELRSLRITSDFDAGRYVAGMNQKVSADNAGTQSSKAVGAAIDGLKIKVSSAIPLIERMSRTYIDGYGSAARFNTELMKLARSQDTSAASVEHLELIYGGLQKKFGLVADASELAVRGYGKLATAIDNVNSRINAQGDATAITALTARVEQLRSQFDPTYVAAQRLTAELNDLAEAERLGVQISGGYERALENIMAKHDAVAASAKRQREEYARLAQEAREAQAADRAQADINQRLGVGSANDNSAAQSAAVFTRQFEIARMRAEQEASNFASDLNSRFFSGAGTSARDSASVFSDQFARQDELDRLRRQQQGAAFTSDLNSRLGLNGFGTSARSSASAFEEAAKSAEELDRKVSILRAQIDPLGAAQNRLNAELAEYDALAQRNAISTTELAQAQALARARYSNTADDMQRQEKRGVGGLPSYQLTNLMYQGTDVVQSLALGMPIQQVFLQQGPQIAQIFAANSAATKGFISSLGLTTVAIGGVVTAIGLGAKSFNDYLVSVKAVETAAAGVGRATAGSASEMEAAARAGADAADISIKSARVMETQFLRTGRIGSQYFEQLIGLSKNFAATIGIDASTSGEKLAEMFSDPAKAAEQLYRQYGLLDGSTADYVQRLMAQNRASDAQAILLNALPQRLVNAAEATTALGRAWDGVASSASNAWDWMGGAVDRAVSGPSSEDRIQQLQRTLALPRVRGREDLEAELNELMERSRRQQQLAAAQSKQQADAMLAAPALDLASGSAATAAARRRRELSDQSSSLSRGLSAGGLNDDQRRDVGATLDATTRALNTLIPAQEKAQRLSEIDIRIANERNPLLRANLAAERERIQLSGEVITAAEAESKIAAARNEVLQDTIASAATDAEQMRTEAALRQRLNTLVASGTITSSDANRLLREEVTLRPLIAAAASAEGAEKERLNKVIAELRTGYAALATEEKRASFNDFIRGQSENLEQLRLEKSLIGESAKVRGEALALLTAEQQIRNMGIAATSSEAEQIRNLALEQANLTREIERQEQAWDRVRQAGENAIDGVFDNLFSGDWKGALESLGKEVADMFSELTFKNPLKNAIFGTNYGTIFDVNGWPGGKSDASSLVGQALGKSVGTMTVSAGVVMLNGGVTGGVGSALSSLSGSGGAANSNILTGSIAQYAAATKAIESGGNYSALGPLTASGDRAYGAYQVMGANIPSWTKNTLGQSMTPKQFLADNSAQDAVFAKYFGGYANKYGASGAAQAWFGGEGSVGKGGAGTDILGTSGNSYVEKFNTQLGRLSDTTLQTTSNVGTLGKGLSTATNGLAQFGSGLGSFGQSLSSALSGGNTGLASLLGSFTTAGINAFNVSGQFRNAVLSGSSGLWSDGGYTGAGGVDEPAGIVHRGEIVWSQADIARAGGIHVVEGMRRGFRGYAEGGLVRGNTAGAIANMSSGLRGGFANDNGSSGAVKGRGPIPINITVRVDGARGDREIEELVQQGVSEGVRSGLEQYDRDLPDRLEGIYADPRLR